MTNDNQALHAMRVRTTATALVILTAAIVLIAVPSLGSSYPPRVRVPKDYTYANLAWGFNNKYVDDINGQAVILVDIDGVSASQVNAYKQAGHIVQCYFSVGTAETFRDDYVPALWKPLGLGSMPQFPDEFWLDLTQLDKIKALMTPRFERAKSLGCDAIEPDNTDCYDNAECKNPLLNKAPGVNVKQLQIEYCIWQVDQAHKLGMSISLKNSLDIIPDLVDLYDFAVNEQCIQYSECDAYQPFLEQNKAVFNHEYSLGSGNTKCNKAASYGVQTKRCAGSPSDGICNAAASWINCFGPLLPLPEITYSNSSVTLAPVSARPTSLRPTKPPTLNPSKRPTSRRPTKSPTPKPSKRPTTRFPTRHRRTG